MQFESLHPDGVCGFIRLKPLNPHSFPLRSADYATRLTDIRLSSWAVHYSTFLWRQCVPLHFTSFWRRRHCTSITKFMSKQRNWPVLFNWFTTWCISVRHVRWTDVSKRQHEPLVLNVFLCIYFVSCAASSTDSPVAVSIPSAKIGFYTDMIKVVDLKAMDEQKYQRPSYSIPWAHY